jgi:hypothetical protein
LNLAFNTKNTPLIDSFLQRYQKWCDSKTLIDLIKHDSLTTFSSRGIPCFRSYQLDNINQCDAELIAIDSLKEGLHEINYFNQYKKNCHYIIFSGGWWNTSQNILDISYTLIFSNFLLYNVAGDFLNPDSDYFYQFRPYDFDYPKEFYFVGVHGQPRAHRVKFQDQLLKAINHKKFILKLDGVDFGQDSSNLDFIKKSDNKLLPDVFAEKFKNYKEGQKAQYQSYAYKMYNHAYFQVVLETDFSNCNQFFLTEKTIRPLMSGQPFVTLATPGFLKHLHKLGFRTYNSLWNEDYDSIINEQDRIQALVDLCQVLETFDWQTHKQELVDIANHNRSQFLNLLGHCDKEFIEFEKIIKTFIKNDSR